MEKKEIKKILDLHRLWRQGDPKGQRADLRGADLRGAYLRGAYLEGADLRGAYLEGADLRGADLRGAYLRGADLRGAYLEGADLRGAYLRGAYLEGADLRGAYLEGADLRGAYLEGADLRGAYLEGADLRGADLRGAYLEGADLEGADLTDCQLPDFQICPQVGSFYAWKKTNKGVIKILVPAKAKRTNSLIGRKCRAEYVKVISGEGCGGQGPNYSSLTYNKGEIIKADKFDSDIRIECTHGIHFFMTKEEAERW